MVQIMVWHRPGDKPLSKAMMVSLLTHICVTRPQWVIPRHKISQGQSVAKHRRTPLLTRDDRLSIVSCSICCYIREMTIPPETWNWAGGSDLHHPHIHRDLFHSIPGPIYPARPVQGMVGLHGWRPIKLLQLLDWRLIKQKHTNIPHVRMLFDYVSRQLDETITVKMNTRCKYVEYQRHTYFHPLPQQIFLCDPVHPFACKCYIILARSNCVTLKYRSSSNRLCWPYIC